MQIKCSEQPQALRSHAQPSVCSKSVQACPALRVGLRPAARFTARGTSHQKNHHEPEKRNAKLIQPINNRPPNTRITPALIVASPPVCASLARSAPIRKSYATQEQNPPTVLAPLASSETFNRLRDHLPARGRPSSNPHFSRKIVSLRPLK